MEKGYEKQYHDVEEHHWWFKSRRKYLLDLLKNTPRSHKILDIGCSSGMFLKDLEKLGFAANNLYGVDISEKAIENCQLNGLQNSFVMDAQEINLDVKFDVIISSDCLEHLRDDEKALQNWETLLAPGGKMYVFVPAFQSLWSYHDESNMHFRRYTRSELIGKIKKQHFSIERAGYWNFTLFIPVYAFRRLSGLIKQRKSAESDITLGNQFINSVLMAVLAGENKLLRFVNFPFGISTFCIAKKTIK